LKEVVECRKVTPRPQTVKADGGAVAESSSREERTEIRAIKALLAIHRKRRYTSYRSSPLTEGRRRKNLK